MYPITTNQVLNYATTNREGYKEHKSIGYIGRDCPELKNCTQNRQYTKTVTRHIWQEYLDEQRITKKTAAFVRDGMIELLRSISSAYPLSVTPDRGQEFSFHEQVTDAVKGMSFYFPKPHAPWKRGSNENTNGLIREYCSKFVDVDIENFDEGQITSFIATLNHRPRKCLG